MSNNLKDNMDQLKLFNEKAEKLIFECTLSQSEERRSLQITWDKERYATVKRVGPDQESIEQFVLTFRFFIQDNEGCSIRNINKVYERLPISQELKDKFKYARNELNRYLDSKSSLSFRQIKGEIKKHFSNREIYDIFIYGGLAHANLNKKEIYDRWMVSPLKEIIIATFVGVLLMVGCCINFIKTVNTEVIELLKEI